MDVFLAGCQGLGLALAAGALAGAPGRPQSSGGVWLALAGMAAGAALFALSLSADDHPAWPGLPAGALVGLLSWWVVSDVVAGARAREQASGRGVGLFVAVYALVVAGLSLVVSPVALAALAATAWLALGRRRREARKYEGLRSLR
jgi:hypothetical protein